MSKKISQRRFGKSNHFYKHGKTLEKYYCKCGNELSNYKATMCQDCYFKTVGDEGNPNFKYTISAEEIYRLYWDEELSVEEVAKVFGCSIVTIYKKMLKYNIPRRTLSEAHKLAYTKKKNSLSKMNFKMENNPNWRGGKSFEPYPLNWNKTFKEQIRYRDGYTCQLCGCPEIECRRKLSIHHIDYNKENLNPNNLISLCVKCHCKTNSYREYWENYFNNVFVKSVKQKSIKTEVK